MSTGLLRAADVTGAPVMDENDALVGVISRNDLLKALLTITPEEEAAGGEVFAAALVSLEATLVADVMSRESITISPTSTMLEAAKLLAREKLNRLMVVDPESGELCGVLSSTDVVFAMLGCGTVTLENEGEDEKELRTGNLYRKGIY
jgi:CBS domain-containing protein